MTRIFYFGPRGVWYRFLAGLTVTTQNLLDDDSLWIVVRATRWHLQQFSAAMEANP